MICVHTRLYFKVISTIECGKKCKHKEAKPLKEYQQVGEDPK